MDVRTRVLLVTFLIIHSGFALARLCTTGVVNYRLTRLHTIVMTLTGMMFASTYIWRRVNISIRYFFPSAPEVNRRLRLLCVKDIAQGFLILFLFLSHIAFFFFYIFLGSEPNFFAFICLTLVAAYAHLLVFLILADAFYQISKLVHKKITSNSVYEYLKANRSYHIFLALVLAFLFTFGGLYATQRDPIITRANIPMKTFENDSGGNVTLALLTDIHIGPTVGRRRISTIVKMTNELKPDIIAIAGDLADGLVVDLKGAAEPLCELRAPGGVYFATGNHEYMHGDVREWFDFLKKCNITILHNANRHVNINGHEFCMAGADDLYAEKAHLPGHGMDLKKSLEGCTQDSTNILLAHQPNAAKRALDDADLSQRVNLILSGHTHAGQMYLFVPIVHIANAFVRGLYYNKIADNYVYVSAGVNYFGPPIKIFGGCEIIQINMFKP
ncbi:unnamed protein product [Caenorhabditis bovis]|uniref:Calcineurin-like phosphoesterase domain-containing protein n=1 Tax=Caenorhabditis bovis TaxID=2654633 RepID=A0A8S1EH42_9PELO|nr:unnamed protein product [Caenorhabditis bovis]